MSKPAKYVLPLAYSTVAFYSLLTLVSGWFYRKFSLVTARNKHGDIHRSNVGKFDEAKSWFFLLLTLSAAADIPLFVGCIAENGPHDCEWDGASYAIFWFMHLCAVCGYTYTIIIPCLLWSDMINKKDGKLFTSKYPADNTKRLFQVALLCYIGLTICDIIFGGLYYKVSDHGAYNGNFFHMLCTLLEPVFICAIAFGCVWCGIRLQTYVRQAKLGFKTEVRFLFHMNVTMVVIASTYIARGVFVLQLVSFLPNSFRSSLRVSYFVWLLCTRWLPYIFCSFCLIVMMRASGEEVAKRRGTTRMKSVASGDATPTQGILSEDKPIGVLQRLSKFPAALMSAIYNPQDFKHDRVHSRGGHESHEFSASLLSDVDFDDDESQYSTAILSGNTVDDGAPARTVSVSSNSNPSMDLVDNTPLTTPMHNKMIPPPSNSSMYTGYSPPPTQQSTWVQQRNRTQSPAVAGQILRNPSPAASTL